MFVVNFNENVTLGLPAGDPTSPIARMISSRDLR